MNRRQLGWVALGTGAAVLGGWWRWRAEDGGAPGVAGGPASPASAS